MRALLFLTALLAGPSLAAAPPPEMRGLWVVRTALVSPEDVDRVVDGAAAAGFNALFVQVRGRGDAFYESSLVPRSPILGNARADFDPLARTLVRARARGLEVHAWVNVLLTAHFGQPLPAGHVLLEHPDWLMVPRSLSRAAREAPGPALLRLVGQARADGDAEGYYLSPFAPGVSEHLEAVVRELLQRYAVDGVHLDFVRYPGPDYDYSRPALDSFRRRSGGEPAGSPAAWDGHRREALTGLVSRLVRTARASRPGLVVSAAVVPDEVQAVEQKFQGWPAWMEEGLLEAVCPMTYTPDSRVFVRQVEQARTRLRSGQLIWAGIGAYRLPLDGVIEKIRLARQVGASGVLLFSHESFTPGDLERLRVEVFPAPRRAAASGPRSAGAE